MADTRDFAPVLGDIAGAIKALDTNTSRPTKAEAAVIELRKERTAITRRLLRIESAANELPRLDQQPIKEERRGG